MATLSIRIDLDGGGRLGPGKARLLKAVEDEGSISAAGAALGMSYRRAWLLIAEMNTDFGQPVVETRAGGRKGGGAGLSETGRFVLRAYELAQSRADEAVAALLRDLEDRRAAR